MNIRQLLLTIICISLSLTSLKGQSGDDVDRILLKSESKLKSLKKISFEYYRDIHYKSDNYRAENKGKVFVDFTIEDTIVPFRFQDHGEDWSTIYNGSELFNMGGNDSTIEIEYGPRKSRLGSQSFLLNSPITLRFGLSTLRSNKNIEKSLRDTFINNKKYFLAIATLKKSVLGSLGDIFPITIERNITYQILINKADHLPYMIIQKNNHHPDDYMITKFDNYNLKPKEPSSYSWFTSSYIDKFKPKVNVDLISAGAMAPAWNLPFINKSGLLNLESLRGKVVLMEFWFKNCGPCIEAVPFLNNLKDKFKNTDFELVAINAEDDLKDALWFVEKRKVKYTTVYQGKQTAKRYGVSNYPTTILVDKTGKIIYAGGFNKTKIEELIAGML